MKKLIIICLLLCIGLSAFCAQKDSRINKYNTLVCPVCNQKGYVACPFCNGSGKNSNPHSIFKECTGCKGTGAYQCDSCCSFANCILYPKVAQKDKVSKEKCTHCKHTGFVTCSKCMGNCNLKQYNFYTHKTEIIKCLNCKLTPGKEPCPWCKTESKNNNYVKPNNVKPQIPYVGNDVDCPMCYGSKKMDCSTCQGTGRELCWECGGLGYKDYIANGEYRTKQCTYCRGNGKKQCSFCYGKGKVRCTVCQ